MHSFLGVRRSLGLFEVFLIGLGVWFFAALPARAADLYWTGTIDDWSVAANWGGNLPASTDYAYIVNGGTVLITQPDEACTFLYLGDAGDGSSGAIEMTDGTLTVYQQTIVGNTGVGTFTQMGGTHTIPGSPGGLILGYGAGSSGTYTLGGSGQLVVTATEQIGYDPNATALFQQTGGTNSAGMLAIGRGGTYLLTGGTLEINGGFQNDGVFDGGGSAATIEVKSASIANFSSGQIVNAGAMALSLPAGSLAIVPQGFDPASVFQSYSNAGLTHVLGTTLTVGAQEGFHGNGTIVDPVVCAGNIDATSEINLNGGLALSAGTVQLANGKLITDGASSSLSGGTLSAAKHYVGYASSGSFAQTAGSNHLTSLYLGAVAGATGTYQLSGGTLSSMLQYVGYASGGDFQQTAGANSASSLYLGQVPGATGTYELTGGTLNSSSETIGNSGSGVFSHSAGSNTVGALYVGYRPGSTGAYAMSGTASLSASTLIVGYQGTGTFTNSATATTVNSLTLGSAAGSNGTYNLSGAGRISAMAQEIIGQTGTGTFNQDSGSNMAMGMIQLAGMSASSGTYNLTGTGFVSTPQLVVGGSGTGVFTQSAGTVSISAAGSSPALVLAGGTNARGTYNLSGTGALSATTETVGLAGVGVFNQSGGTNTVFGTLTMATNYGSLCSGTYNLSGAGQLFAATETWGPGKATFNQTGGVHQVAGVLSLGGSGDMNVGAYNLSGGTLSSAVLNVGYSGGAAIFVNSGGAHYVENQMIVGGGGTTKTPARYSLSGTGTLTVAGIGGMIVGSSYPGRFEWFNNGLAAYKITVQGQGTLAMGIDFDFAALLGGSLYHGTAASISSASALEITNGATATSTASTNYGFNALMIGTAAGPGTCNLSGTGTLSAGYEYVGYSSNGILSISAGTNTVGSASGFVLGYNTGVQGTCNLSGTGALLAGIETVGYAGSGALSQTGGVNNCSMLFLGAFSGSSGTYTLEGTARLNSTSGEVGYGGTGTFIQSGGTNSVSQALTIGSSAGATGYYTLSGTGQLTADAVNVGGAGSGEFNQTGGTNRVNTLHLTSNSGSTGTYNLSGDGTIAANVELIGAAGPGVFNQTGGSNSVSQILYVGYSNSGSNGTYNLSGGTLSAAMEYVMGATGRPQGVFAHTAGSNSTNGMAIWTNGRYTLSGTGSLTVGPSSPMTVNGRFEWFGGAVSTPTMAIDGGVLAMGFDFDLNALLSGTLFGGSPLTLTQSTIELTNGATASYSAGTSLPLPRFNLGTTTGAGNLDISGSASLTAGYMTVGLTGSGTVTQTGGVVRVIDGSQGLTLASAAGSHGEYNLSGGTLAVAQITVGQGTALFNFGGGTLQAQGQFSTLLPMTLTGVGGNAHVETNHVSIMLEGLLSGPGGLDKLGEGQLALSAANSYSGDTIVHSGTMKILGGIDPAGTKLIDIQGGTVYFMNTAVNRPDLVVNTAAWGTFEIADGNHVVGSITGTGTTKVDSGNLTVGSLTQDSLVIGSTAQPQSVPEPGAAVLLLAGLFVAGAMRRVVKRS